MPMIVKEDPCPNAHRSANEIMDAVMKMTKLLVDSNGGICLVGVIEKILFSEEPLTEVERGLVAGTLISVGFDSIRKEQQLEAILGAASQAGRKETVH